MRYKLQKITALLAAALLLTGCAKSADNSQTASQEAAVEGEIAGERLTLGYAADKVFSLNYNAEYSYNPLTTSSTLNLEIGGLLYEPLVELDEYFAPQPKLFASWSSSDGINWMFTVSDEYSFHDGTLFTAYDAYYTLVRAMRSDRYKTRLACVAGVSVMGSNQVAVRLYAANTQFPALLDIPAIKDGQIDEWTPDGCGPYVMDVTGTKLTLYSGHPEVQDMPIDEIHLKECSSADDIITAFEDSIIDLVTNDPTGSNDLGYGGANEVRYFATTNMHYLGFNMDSGFFRYSSYRAAMNYIVNRSYITTNVCGGCATEAALPANPLFSLYNAGYAKGFDYNVEKCLSLLDSAGVKDTDGDGLLEYLVGGTQTEIELTFIVNGENAAKVAAARRIADDLEHIGFTIIMHELSWESYKEALQEGEYDIYYGEVKMTADFDPSCMLTEGGAACYCTTMDPNYLTYIEKYVSSSDEERQMHADLMWQYIATTAPIVTICFEKQEVVTHRNVVSGMTPTQSDIFYNLSEWKINLSGE